MDDEDGDHREGSRERVRINKGNRGGNAHYRC